MDLVYSSRTLVSFTSGYVFVNLWSRNQVAWYLVLTGSILVQR
jgi:hypothetical protein